MKIRLKVILTCLLICAADFLFAAAFCSCTTEITVTQNKDGSTDVVFNGGAGDAFSKLISSATGGYNIIDSQAVKAELEKEGFSNVQVTVKSSSDVQIKMTDKNRSTYLYSSGLLKNKEDAAKNVSKLELDFSNKNIKEFYASADEQTCMILDLFVAPVFNDEIMPASNYISLLGSVYGSEAGDEIKNSTVRVNLVSANGEKTTAEYELAQILSGNFAN